MVLIHRARNRGIEWVVGAMAAAAAVAGLWVLIEAPAPLNSIVGSSLIAASIALALLVAQARDAFVWSAEDGVLFAEWTASGQRMALPLEGVVRLESRRVEAPDHDASWEVEVALVDSPDFGRVHLWESKPGRVAPERERWKGLTLRSVRSKDDERRLAQGAPRLKPGWSWLERCAMVAGMAVVGGPLSFIASQPETVWLGSLCLAVATLVLAYALACTFAVIEVRHEPGLVAYRRCILGVPLSEWRGIREPLVLDLSRYPRVEWRLPSGEPMLVVRGGPRGVTPVDALRLTAVMRQELGTSAAP